jgi:hypothetical protein
MAKQLALDFEDDETEVDDDYSDVLPGEGRKSKDIVSFWKKQIKAFDKENADFIARGQQIIDRFMDKRSKAEAGMTRRMNVLWSNFKILKPALYSKEPIPNIDRKFLDRDPKGRLSAQILERTVRNEIEHNGLHDAISRAVDDYLLPGRGQVWIRYEPVISLGESITTPVHNDLQAGIDKILEIDDKKYESTQLEDDAHEDNDNETEDELDDVEEEQLETTGEQLLTESVPVDYINWKDFYMFPADARTWTEVQAVGKKVYISKREAVTRFGREIGKKLRPGTLEKDDNDNLHSGESSYEDLNVRTICIYEIWNRSDKKVYWICPTYDYLCDIKDDPLGLTKFFPCPMPISSTITNNSMQVAPDYFEYQDQAIQIDELTTRIAMLTKACKVVGTYNAAQPEVARLLDEATENKLIPVDNWALFGEKGGVEGAMSFLPIDKVQSVITTLIEARSLALQDLDLITGITDIQRGTTDSRETLGGIRLKNNNTGSRLQDRQNQIAEFAKDIIILVTEVISKQFDTKTLIEASGILLEDDLQPENVLAEYHAKMDLNKPSMSPGALPGMPPEPPQAMQPPGMSPVVPPQGAPNTPSAMPSMLGLPPMPMGMGTPPASMGLAGLLKPITPIMPTVDELIARKLEPAIKLIRDNVLISYRIDIETDSTIFGDAAQERQDATEFVGAVTQYITGVAQAVQEMPEALPLFGAMLRFAVRKFRTGRDLESTIDTFVTTMENKSKKMKEQGPPPDPKIEAEKLKQAGEEKRQQREEQAAIQAQQAQAANDQRDAAKQQAEDQRTFMLQQSEDERESQQLQLNAQIAQKELEMKLKEMEAQAIMQEQEHKFKMEEMAAQHAEKMATIKAAKDKPEKKGE